MTRVLHTARISNVDGVMFLIKGRHVCKCQPLWLTSRAPKV